MIRFKKEPTGDYSLLKAPYRVRKGIYQIWNGEKWIKLNIK